MRGRIALASLVAAGAAGGAALIAEGQQGSGYTENVTFRLNMNDASYRGPADEIYMLLDRAGGRNRLQDAKRLTHSGGGHWEVSLPLAEGDYIYVFVANPRQYVDLTDPNLNPDDVPDSNFFNDPHPRFTGFGGQYGKDNVHFVRNPRRPKLDPQGVQPTSGKLITSAPIDVRARVRAGSDGAAIDAATARVRIERGEPYGLGAGPLEPPPIDLDDVPGVVFTPGSGGGEITARIADPPEGIHLIHVDVSNASGLEADTLFIPVYINRQNQTPVADAGPSRFTVPGRWVEVDGGLSHDPDEIGFSAFTWRKVSGPGNMEIRSVSQEPDNRNVNQRRWDGVPVVDGDGNIVANTLPATGAVPQVRFDAPGEYVVGLKVTDREGAQSQESTTTVQVAARNEPAWRMRLHAGLRGGRLVVSAAASDLPDGMRVRFHADARTPLVWTQGADGLEAEADLPAPGTYFVNAQAGDLATAASYPAQIAIAVGEGGTIAGRDVAKPSPFWRDDAVLYLLFVREFHDSDGDGEGDLRGAIQKIPWMKQLGINTIWMMPVEPSGTTHGYSMDSFFAVHPDYGTAQELEEFVTRAHQAGIRVVLDNVLNHTSPVHLWFTSSRDDTASVPRDRFIYRPDGSFQYAFDFVSLPDLDYNNPIVRRTAIERARFWMARGFDGFRCDIAGFTPMGVWRDIRREVLKRQIDGFMLAEIIPPTEDYIEDQFDALYDAHVYWETRDAFAGNKQFSALDGAMKSSERFVQNAPRAYVREKIDPRDLLRIRYLGNQDEDRFLLLAGRSIDRQRVAAAVLLSMPGIPLITYGDEIGLVEGRGRMKFDVSSDLFAHYRKYVRIRNGNPGLRGQSTDNAPNPGNRYARLSSDGDLNANQIFSFLRHGNNQVFVILANRGPSPVIGTPVTYYLANEVLSRLPDVPIVMTNHARPSDVLTVRKSQLVAGHTSQVGSYEVKVYQLLTVRIPDEDGDDIPDSYDRCAGVTDREDLDEDYDGVADACDHCPGTTSGADVGMNGCAREPGKPKPAYSLDGRVDDESFLVSESGELQLYASFNGKDLYVAMTGAVRGQDHVIFLRDDATAIPLQASRFGKRGRAAARWALIDEGRGDRAEWEGPWVGTRARGGSPVSGGVVESTINLVERFGKDLPASIGLAGVRYGAGTGAGAQVILQVPAAVTPGDDIESGELVEIPLVKPEIKAPEMMMTRPDAGMGGNGSPDAGGGGGGGGAIEDLDDDGVADGLDNCLTMPNPDQGDADQDKRGDACDVCPLSRIGAPIDAEGCEPSSPAPPTSAFDRPKPIPQGETFGCTGISPPDGSRRFSSLLMAALFLLLVRTRGRR